MIGTVTPPRAGGRNDFPWDTGNAGLAEYPADPIVVG
jgi:hypothetical protein